MMQDCIEFTRKNTGLLQATCLSSQNLKSYRVSAQKGRE
jgi:hypothetical protein